LCAKGKINETASYLRQNPDQMVAQGGVAPQQQISFFQGAVVARGPAADVSRRPFFLPYRGACASQQTSRQRLGRLVLTMKFHLRLAASTLAATVMLSASAVSAQTIYRHIDSEGRVTFSDRPARASALSPRRSSVVNANEASRRLTQMQQTRWLGMTPLPGETEQGAAGNVVNARYWHRQEGLRVAVEQAQRRSNQTQLLLLADR
jgi:hypothetical protein